MLMHNEDRQNDLFLLPMTDIQQIFGDLVKLKGKIP
jgi:hypothetical protein